MCEFSSSEQRCLWPWQGKSNEELSVDQAKVWYIMAAYLRPYHHEFAFILKLISRCHFIIQFSPVHCNVTQAITIFSIPLKSISVAFVFLLLVGLHAFSLKLEFSVCCWSIVKMWPCMSVIISRQIRENATNEQISKSNRIREKRGASRQKKNKRPKLRKHKVLWAMKRFRCLI